MHLDGIAIEVAWRLLPVLPFPLVHVQPHRVAIGARELRVDVHEGLHPVVPGGQIPQAGERVPAVAAVECHRLAGLQPLDIFREQRYAFRAGLLNRRGLAVAADREIHHPRDRLAAYLRSDPDLDAQGAAGLRCQRGPPAMGRKSGQDRHDDKTQAGSPHPSIMTECRGGGFARRIRGYDLVRPQRPDRIDACRPACRHV